MKFSVALALLLSSVAGVTNSQQQHDGIGEVVVVSSPPQHKKISLLRGPTIVSLDSFVTADLEDDDATAMAAQVKCMAFKETNECNADADCTWCEAGAVPSACYGSVMSEKLPSGTFKCGHKSSTESTSSVVVEGVLNDAEEKIEKIVGKVDKILEVFDLKEGMTHTLSSAEVDKTFCDASSPLSLAGYMNIKGSQFDTENDKNLFYWMFEKRTKSQIPSTADAAAIASDDVPEVRSESMWNWPWDEPAPPAPAPASNPKEEDKSSTTNPADIPLVIWLTGGPGCSSTLALLSENGPCKVNDDGATTKINPYSWTESAHVLWLDQPADVGYSYGQGNDTNEQMISEDAYYFLQGFFKSENGKKYKDAPLFIVGESYGGHYAPAIAHRIWEGNNKLQSGLEKLNLKGLAVGNGLTDPEEQYKWYAEMAFKNSHNLQVIDESTYTTMKSAEPLCTKGIVKCNEGTGFLDSFACQAAFLYCNTALTTPFRATGKNPYDIRKPCGLNPLCYDFSHIEKFMNSDKTKEALHVKEHNPSWETCNMEINLEFHVDWMKNFAPYVKDLLEAGIPALIYAGDVDFICNYLGNRAWTLNLDWSHKQDYNAATEKDWNKGGGLVRSANGLTFLQVYDAGHMVPSDQPEHALQMITQFLNGQAF